MPKNNATHWIRMMDLIKQHFHVLELCEWFATKTHFAQNCSGKQNQTQTRFSGFGPNPGPGRLSMDLGRGDVEFARVFVSVTSVAISSVFEFIRWNREQIKGNAPNKTGTKTRSGH